MNLKKKHILLVFSIVLISVIISNCNVKADYTNSVKIDTIRNEEEYSLIAEDLNYTVYFANSHSKYYLFTEFSYNLTDKEIYLVSGILTFNLTSQEIENDFLHSRHANNSLEIAISRSLIEENKLTLNIDSYDTIDLVLVPSPTPVFIPEEEDEEEEEVIPVERDMYLSDYGWMTIIIIILIVFAMYDVGRRGLTKKIIKAYIQVNKEIETLDTERKLSKLQVIGEVKSQKEDEERNCYKIRIRHKMKNKIIYSDQPLDEYFNKHLIDRNYHIFYSLNANLFEKELSKSEQYEDELGWSIQAYIYRGLSFFFNLTGSGIPFSMLICGFIFMGSLPTISWAFLLGCGIGFIISVINYILRNHTKIVDPLITRKKELITSEIYMSPLEASEIVIDIWRVWGTEEVEVPTSDKAVKTQTRPLLDRDENDQPLIDKETKKPVDYKTVRGYDEYYELLESPLVKIKKDKHLGVDQVKRSNQEMLSSRRSYLDRNRAIVEDKFRLKKTNRKLQKDVRNLQAQIQMVLETQVQKLTEFGVQISKQKEWQENTLKKVFEKITGKQFIDDNWERIVGEVYRELKEEEQIVILDNIKSLFRLVNDLVNLIGEHSGLNTERLSDLITQIKRQGELEIATKS